MVSAEFLDAGDSSVAGPAVYRPPAYSLSPEMAVSSQFVS
jgi:hypothetical protein